MSQDRLNKRSSQSSGIVKQRSSYGPSSQPLPQRPNDVDQQQPFIKRWLNGFQRHTTLRQLGIFDNVRMLRLSNAVYDAVYNHKLCNLLPSSNRLNPKNYFYSLQNLLNYNEARRGVNMRLFDLFNHRLTINSHKNRVNKLTRYEVEIKRSPQEHMPISQNDIVLLRDPDTKLYRRGNVESVQEDLVILLFDRTEETRTFLQKPLDISIIPDGSFYDCYLNAIERARDNPYIRGVILESSSLSSLENSSRISEPNILLEPGLSEANERLNKLDKWQRQAIEGILAARCRPKPYIIFGPPGTGKTHVLAEAIIQIYLRDQSAKILFCADSNFCADQIRCKLRASCLIAPFDIWTLSTGGREEDMATFSIYVTTNIKSASLLNKFAFDYVMLDEANHIDEQDSLLPISLLKENGCLVLAGDTKQFGPKIECSQRIELGLEKSLFERVINFNVYIKKPGTNKYDNNYITKLLLCHRCDQRVIAISNQLFYSGELVCLNKTPTSILKFLNLTNPVQFYHINGIEREPPLSSSWENEEEAEYCSILMQNLCKIGFDRGQIGVMSPYKAQAKLISNKSGGIKNDSPDHFKIDTIDGFRGDEREIIIVSTVRSSPNCPTRFFDDPRRVNVALSRAKWLLIVVGNLNALMTSSYWREFVYSATQNEISSCGTLS